ncbi:uncharacterized protein K452DRAFT_320792 [Aplosporella prunicola CBS 121167]|uniref:AA1-like domain-containing protein n=1 Tax=Aplosporella prunicola CBS 121167 TaxID=1176127 RepID=A0A6A6B579_9PEZI|nr:uncharacterized protein K452DRAFT_320792 [Aplosporella prunicola CBS 121167]KAF2139200.1 hypothetical protein K452DRAFT_320792 [Aplosporella prunicola CBS 121167]
MFLTTILSTLALLPGSVLSAEFNFTDVYYWRRQNINNQEFQVWENNNPLSNETGAWCHVSFSDTLLNWPTDYIPCADSTSWDWYVVNWTHENFTFEIRHNFTDSSTQTFHQRFARFVETNYTECQTDLRGTTSCTFPSGVAEVYDEKITPLP